MSDLRKTADIHETLSGDWWNFAAAFGARFNGTQVIASRRIEGQSVIYRVMFDDTEQTSDPPYPLGEIMFTGARGETDVYIKITGPDPTPFWPNVIAFLRNMAVLARTFHREATGQTFKDILDEYYQRKDSGERITLKALAAAADVNYDSLRQAKIRYDEARPRGNASTG